MKHAALAVALMLASLPVAAHGDISVKTKNECKVHTDWGVRAHRMAFVFERQEKAPAEVGIGGGRLFVDGKEQRLSAADHARLKRMEAEMHALVPQLREVTIAAVDVAFTALVEVARGLAGDPQGTIADLEKGRLRLRAKMQAQPLAALDGDAIGRTIGPIMGEFVPDIVAGAVRGALSAAFGGERKAQEFEKKMQRMEQELDKKVERQAKELEPLAEAMCQRLQAMDRIDDQLEFRLPDGSRLELLRVGPRDQD